MFTIVDRGELRRIDRLEPDQSMSTSLRVFWNNHMLAYSITTSYCSKNR